MRNIFSKSNKKNIKILASIILIGVGLFTSYRESFHLWYADSDISVIPLVINALHGEGISFLSTFHFPVDNWLFSLIFPLLFITKFVHLGPHQVLLLGVFIFWMSAFFMALIVALQVGWKRALWSMGLVLCASQIAIGRGGFLTYPVAHNISMLWGFLALIFSLIYIKKEYFLSLLLSFVVFALVSFSDPWMLPVFILPIICSAGLMCFFVMGRERKRYLFILAMGIAVIFFCKIDFLGFLKIGHLYTSSFTALRLSFNSLLNMLGAFSYYFNIIPGFNFNNYYAVLRTKDLGRIVLFIVAMAFNFLIFCWIFFRVISFLFKRYNLIKNDTLFLIGMILFSVLGIVASIFIFDGMPIIKSSRYMINIYYMIIMLFCMLPYDNMQSQLKRSVFLIGALWVSSSIVSNQSAWGYIEDAKGYTSEVLSVLQEEHIQYAYGDYWGVDANALTWQSHEAIKVRPLVYIQDYQGFLPSIWSSPLWYHVPPHQKWAFVVTGLADDKTCTPYPSCREAVLHQFGPPLEVKDEKRFSYFIYDSDKTQLLADLDVEHWAKPIELPIGSFPHWKLFEPNEDMNGDGLVIEPLPGGARKKLGAALQDTLSWDNVSKERVNSLGKKARIALPVITARPNVAEMWVHLSSASATVRDVDVLYKGRTVAQWRLPTRRAVHYLEVPVEMGQQSLELEFSILNPEPGKHGSLRGIRLHGVQMVTQEGKW